MVKKFPWWIGSVMLLGLAIVAKKFDAPILTDVQLKVFDIYQNMHPRPYEEAPVRIIDIDDTSLARIGQWPWPRTVLADLTNKLKEAGAAAIVFDVVFAEADRTSPKQAATLWELSPSQSEFVKKLPDHDRIFADALKEATTVTGMILTRTSPEVGTLKAGFSFIGDDPLPYVPNFGGAVNTLPELVQYAEGNGALNSIPDRDGVLRRMPLLYRVGTKIYPSLSGEALRVAQGASTYIVKSVGASDETTTQDGKRGIVAVKVGAFEIPTDDNGRLWIYYSPFRIDRYIPAWQVLEDRAMKEKIDGHIVLIGTSAAGLKDIRTTPLNRAVAGVEVHAQALEQIMLGAHLSRPDWMEGAEIVLIVLTGLILIICMARLNALWAAGFMLVVLAGSITFSWFSFRDERLLVEPVTLTLTIILLYFSETLRRFVRTEREKARIRHAFNHYMSPALVDQLADKARNLTLGGENREVTVMFCDIRDFSAISECMNPVDLTRFINRFLTPMTDAIMDNEGMIDKYIGDAIMALWNAPLDTENHPQKAAETALEMRKALRKFNEMVRGESEAYGNVPLPVRMGVGLNTGECCVGNMGSKQRFNYSALGNEVDMAARLEGMCKYYGVDIILGSSTAAELEDFAILELDCIRVKGKSKPLTIYTLLGDSKMKENPTYAKLTEANNAMLDAYRNQRWQEASHHLISARVEAFSIPVLRLSVYYRLYESRIAAYKKTPPPREWDGVYTATEK